MASSLLTTGPYTYQPLDWSPLSSTPSSPSVLAAKVGDMESRGGARNVLTSVSNALSKVGQFATQAKREFIADLKKRPLAYLAATIAIVGVLAATLFAPPVVALATIGVAAIGVAAYAGLATARADKKLIQLNDKLDRQLGLITKRPGSYLPIGHSILSALSTLSTKGLKVHGLAQGVLLTEGVKPGDKILKVNGKSVRGPVSLFAAIEKPSADGKTRMIIQRGSETPSEKTIEIYKRRDTNMTA